MKQAVIIGAGIIGCATALQLARRGYRTTNVDKNAEVGSGSTANSCAIVRFSYSTPEGVMLAHEGCHYWLNWPQFLGAPDERGYAKFVQCGHLMLRIDESDRAQVIERYRELGIRFETWDNARIRERLPFMTTESFFPPKPVDDPQFFSDSASEIAGGIFTPDAGYIPDPLLATHNLRRAVEAAGAFSIVLESIPRELGARITSELRIPTIGIGAGPDCDGQVLVIHDLLGLSFGHKPKFTRRYADLGEIISRAAVEYCRDVQQGRFPSDEESYHLPVEHRDVPVAKRG